MESYEYLISKSTKYGEVYSTSLHSEIKSSGVPGFLGINISGDNISLIFNKPIDAEQKNIVDSILMNHNSMNHDKIFNDDDYHKKRNELKSYYEGLDFNSLNDYDKDLVCNYCLMDDTVIINYYISTGLSIQEAKTKHLIRRSLDINRASKACKNRVDKPTMTYIAIKYLTESDASVFLDAVRNFLTDYVTAAHLGLEYNQNRDGIMDYIEATNGFVDKGLKGYEINAPYTYDQCKTEFKNFIVYGIEPTEFDLFSS